MNEPWQLGDTIGRYRLEQLLAYGSMGEVWRAEDVRLGRAVAVKVLKADPDGMALVLFERNAQALAHLTHPSIVQIYDIGRQGDRAYVVTEFVHGVDLATLISWGRVRIGWAVRIARQIAEAIRVVHEFGVTHGDITPHNILIESHEDRAKLADFGLTRDPDLQPKLSMASTAVGALTYTAPEELTGHHPGRASDIYSLGATFYHLFTGSPPRDATKIVSLVREARTRRPQFPHELRPELPEALSAAIMRMLDPRPTKRLLSLTEIIEVLDSVAQHFPPQSGATLEERAIEVPASQIAPFPVSLAIVFGDIAAISHIAAQTGALEVQRVLLEFFPRLERFHTNHRGRFKKTLGDGFLSIFHNVSDAFNFAVVLQRSLSEDPISTAPQERGSEAPPPLALRVSIHVGTVLLVQTSYGEDVYGAGVNLAARLVAFALPGEIVVSTPACLALPSEQRTLLRKSEHVRLKGMSGQLEFSRLALSDLNR